MPTSSARRINPIVRGWMQYYGAFHRSALYQVFSRAVTGVLVDANAV